MRFVWNAKLILVFAVALSLGSLPGPLTSQFRLPTLPSVKATYDLNAGYWYPAGPQMPILSISTFLNSGYGFNSLTIDKGIDVLDSPLSAFQQDYFPTFPAGESCSTSTSFSCSLKVPEHGYSEVDFNLAGVLWGIPQAYGANIGGIELRQGIAHLINKQSFIENEAGCQQRTQNCLAIDQANAICDKDNCVNGGLPAANPCNWDTRYPQVSAQYCIVGAPGGTSYNCVFSTSCPIAAPSGTTTYPWQAQIGSSDFCAAANHFVQAFFDANIQGVTLNPKCELNPPSGGWPSSVTAFPSKCFDGPATGDVCISVQNLHDHLQDDLGHGLSQDLCALFSPAWVSGGWTTLAGAPWSCDNTNTGSGNAACGGGSCPFVQVSGDIINWKGLPYGWGNYCPASTNGIPNNCWGIWTGGCENCFPFDTSLYFKYNSLFATKTAVVCTNADCSTNVPNSTCTSTSPTSIPSDYMYVCVPAYDSLSNLMESAACLASLPGHPTDPVVGSSTPTFADCSGGSVGSGTSSTSCIVASPGCTAISAGYQAEDAFGSRVLTLPIYSNYQVYARQSSWQQGSSTSPGMVDAIGGETLGTPNFFNLLNAYNPNPPVSGTLRLGIAPAPDFLNPFNAGFDLGKPSTSDFLVLRSIYDSLFMQNPMCTNSASQAAAALVPKCSSILQNIDWMTTSHSFLCYTGGPHCDSTNLGYGNSTYFAGTSADLRLSLNRNIHWQDGGPVTAWDVKYSFINLNATGSYQATSLSVISHINVLDEFTLDLNLKSKGPFTEFFLGGVTIIPGHVWSACGLGTWNSGVTGKNIDAAAASIVGAPEDSCVGTFGSPSIVSVGGVRADSPTFDPVTNGFLIGSGPFTCESIGGSGHPPVGTIGGGCSIDNTQSPAPQLGAYTLIRTGCTFTSNGYTCNIPGSSSNYFHSSGALAAYIWTGDIGSGSADFSKVLTVNSCHSSTPSANCPHWELGIGNPGGTGYNPVGLSQRARVNSYKGISWIGFSTEQTTGTQLILSCAAGYTLPLTTITNCNSSNAGWTASVLPGIGGYAPTLYEVGSYPAILYPASIAGPCNPANNYPSGDGYDC